MRRNAWLGPLLAALGGCLTTHGVTYALDPQHYTVDMGMPTGPAKLPSVDCTMCAMLTGLPAEAATSCDPSNKKCMATYDYRLTQPVNLSQQPNFPSSTVSTLADAVSVDAVHYWGTSGLTVDSPPLDIYVGGAAAQTENDPGVTKLGTVPSLPAMSRTDCGSPTAAGTQDAECDVALTDAGRAALATFAKSYMTPFTVIVVAHLTVHAGDAIPAGSLDVYVQPVIAFGIP
jgi:hypothetical protein